MQYFLFTGTINFIGIVFAVRISVAPVNGRNAFTVDAALTLLRSASDAAVAHVQRLVRPVHAVATSVAKKLEGNAGGIATLELVAATKRRKRFYRDVFVGVAASFVGSVDAVGNSVANFALSETPAAGVGVVVAEMSTLKIIINQFLLKIYFSNASLIKFKLSSKE